MEAIKNKAGKYDQRLASKSLNQIKDSLNRTKSNRRKIQLTIQESKEVIEIPIEAMSFLKDILTIMAEGNDLMIIESDSEMSTQEAADILNISRPYLVKLLESGQIPFKKAGTHRRVLVKDIIGYKSQLKKDRRKSLNLLAKQAQELNLGY
jgi:excisionase family DNA binding protein